MEFEETYNYVREANDLNLEEEISLASSAAKAVVSL